MNAKPSLVYFLAQSELTEELPHPPKRPETSAFGSDVTVILSVSVALAAALFIWAFFIRKRQHPDPHVRTLDDSLISTGRHHRHHRRRHRRPKPETSEPPPPTKPSLNETGGLPPARTDTGSYDMYEI